MEKPRGKERTPRRGYSAGHGGENVGEILRDGAHRCFRSPNPVGSPLILSYCAIPVFPRKLRPHTQIHTYTYTHIHTTHIYAHIHTYIKTYTERHRHTHTHMCTYTYIHTMHTQTHMHTDTHIQTHTHIYTHIY